jgi:hypothetical protein
MSQCLTSAPVARLEGFFIREGFWLIMVTEGTEDETEISE